MPNRLPSVSNQTPRDTRFCPSFGPVDWANKKHRRKLNVSRGIFRKAEGTGLEPATPYGALHFQ